jgi:thiol-disulfide isomerase/thioredoxin
MKTKLLLSIALSLLIGLGGCHTNQKQSNYCTVKGTAKGLKDGTKLELQDEFQHYKVIANTTVKDGAFEFHPDISSPTHVYLYVTNKKQLKDFILEPGTILVEVDADDEEDYRYGAQGTPSNDIERKFRALADNGDDVSAKAIMDSILGTEQTGALALDFAHNICDSTAQMLGVLDRLTPELANLDFVAEFREDLMRRLKTEAGGMYIDMEYPDVNGKPISLSSVVNNPNNRYVLVDFWATWCSSCVAKIPELAELYAKYHEKGLELYGISLDVYPEEWENYVKARNFAWVNVCEGCGGGKKNSKVWYDYSLSGIPTTVLIDCQTGIIIARDKKTDELDVMLDELLQK